MAAWGRSARHLVLSWARSEGDVKLRPSNLLNGLGDAGAAGAESDAAAADPLITALRASALREGRAADQASPWPAGPRLPGGTRALQLQSWCPFRATAELRLGAVSVAEPAPGLDRLERGLLLHRALELTWARLRDSRALRALAADERAIPELAHAVSERALRERLARRARPLASALLRNESARLAQLICALLSAELQRGAVAEFAVVQLEDEQERELAGQRLRVRMDRVDRLDDGRLVVLDYKSGAARPFQALERRPHQPQLLAYAQLVGGELAGVAAVYLNADEIGWRGAAADDTVLPGLGRAGAPPTPWPQLLAHWRGVIDALVRGFAAGEAAVDPLPGVCASCHLPALCRINPDAQDLGEATDAS
jgi:ATP-dependent helicase/nuclease subunit B